MLQVAALLFGPPQGGSFVQSGERGLARAVQRGLCNVTVEHCFGTGLPERIESLRRLAVQQPDLIILHGGQGEAPLQHLATEWPDQRFAINQGSVQAHNVAMYEVMLEEPAYLAGALAAWSTRTGVIGHLSGEKVGPGLRGQAAYAAGARDANPEIKVLSEFCGQQHDPALAAACIRRQALAGADIVFTMLGQGRAGAIAACRETGIRQIGDGIDWCMVEPDVFLASAVADAAWCCETAIEDLALGRFTPDTHKQAGLDIPDVCYLAMQPTVPDDIRKRLAALPHYAAPIHKS